MRNLNPADQFLLMYDRELYRERLVGNFCCLVLCLEGNIDACALKDRIDQFQQLFPQSSANLETQGKRYYWQEQTDTTLYTHHKDVNLHCREHITQLMYTQQHTALHFHLFSAENTHQVILRWHHPLTDAKGAEAILSLLIKDLDLQASVQKELGALDTITKYNQQLSFWQRIKSIKQAFSHIRHIRKLNSAYPIATKRGQYQSCLLQLDPAKTKKINDNARKKMGLTGTNLYYIACIMRTLHTMKLNYIGDAFQVPYAVNLRPCNAIHPLFGNQVSFLFAHASLDIVGNREQLFSHLKQQYKNTVSQKLDYAFIPLMSLSKRLSLEKYAKLVRLGKNNKEASSFWFSNTGKFNPKSRTAFNANITNLYPLSPVTAPPGLAILVNQFEDQLNLSINYIQARKQPFIIDTFCAKLEAELLLD
jgi:NRPS condensation-like uncharacterized protein